MRGRAEYPDHEFDTDQVPWMDDLVTIAPDIKDGYLTMPEGPGWGTEVDEAAVRAHRRDSVVELHRRKLGNA